MDDLLARLEEASEGHHDLDEDIALALGIWRAWLSKHRYWILYGPEERREHWPEYRIKSYDRDTGDKIDLTSDPWHDWSWHVGLPEYTCSLDAAITLVPDVPKLMWDVAKYPDNAAAFVGYVEYPARQFLVAATPSLALCIAVLRFQREMDVNGGTT